MSRVCPITKNYILYPECMECKEKICDYFFCLVVGTRTFDNYCLLKNKLDKILSKQTKVVIVSGGASGADALAKKYAEENKYQYIEFKADWNTLGKAAGPIRNEQMHKFICNFAKRGVVAFWDGKSRGTKTNFELAKKYNNQIKIVKYNLVN